MSTTLLRTYEEVNLEDAVYEEVGAHENSPGIDHKQVSPTSKRNNVSYSIEMRDSVWQCL